MLKMALPHVGLAVFLFFYLILGAYAFQYQEYDADKRIQLAKLNTIRERYRDIENEVKSIIGDTQRFNDYKHRLFQHLSSLSTIHEGRKFESDSSDIHNDALPPRWTTPSSILYALSILTTTGYAYAVPVTALGQCFAMIYGLIGIPLMVLAAVDFGRFLSNIVLSMYSKYLELLHRAPRGFFRSGAGDTTAAATPTCAFKRLDGDEKDKEDEENKLEGEDANGGGGEKEIPEKRLPLVINASILLIFCMLGGVVYIAAGGQASFIEAFFVTFNLVANLTMSEMPSELNQLLTIVYIFVFVTCGVAVLSMSAELAALELKELFMKIHYFGRKINFKRKKSKKEEEEEQIDVQVKELLKIIEEIRRKYPEKEKITTLDILEYMHENTTTEKLNERRDTIAFMPQTMEVIKFADEQDMEDRSFLRLDDIPLVGSSNTTVATMIDIASFGPDENMEKRFKREIRKYTTEIKFINRHGKISKMENV